MRTAIFGGCCVLAEAYATVHGVDLDQFGDGIGLMFIGWLALDVVKKA